MNYFLQLHVAGPAVARVAAVSVHPRTAQRPDASVGPSALIGPGPQAGAGGGTDEPTGRGVRRK